MSPMDANSEGVQDRLLKAACEVFAEKGFRDATIAEICKRADANIAAVNYYFRSKENLYVQAWRAAFKASISAYPPDGGVPSDAPAEQRLRGRILSLIRRVADPGNREFDIVHKELAAPTGLLQEVIHETLEPIRKEMARVIRELLGENATEKDVELCRMSIVAQCIHPLARLRRRREFRGAMPPGHQALSELDIDEIADHVFRFSLAGIREVRRRLDRSVERAKG